jgi:hypothetical protein
VAIFRKVTQTIKRLNDDAIIEETKNLKYKIRMIKTCFKYIISYVTISLPLLNVWYIETFNAVMIGIRVYASKEFYNALLCN